MEDIRRIRRELVYKGKILNFYEDYMALPNGNTAVWDFIEHKGAAAVVPVTSDGKILMVRQYRNALERYTLEIPAGAVNYLGEPKEECAARELEEETGYRAGKLEWLMNVNTTVAFCNELIGIYVAQDLIPTSQHLDEDEFLQVCKMKLSTLISKIMSGEIKDAKTIVAAMKLKELRSK